MLNWFLPLPLHWEWFTENVRSSSLITRYYHVFSVFILPYLSVAFVIADDFLLETLPILGFHFVYPLSFWLLKFLLDLLMEAEI